MSTTQKSRNEALLASTKYLKAEVTSQALPLRLDLSAPALTAEQVAAFQAVEIETARTAIQSVASLAKLKEVDHMGGGLDLVSALAFSMAVTDFEKVEYTIENAHCSIGYYALLATLGFVDPQTVIDGFRRGLDIPGHVSWVPGGTQLNGGRLGVMIPVAVGQALGKRARLGDDAWVICHCGDAGWVSGQALNGFHAAELHKAPVTFVMHRNGIQLSGSTKSILDKDPRPIIKSLGIEIIETPSLHDHASLFQAYKKARELARQGKPSLIYPTGTQSTLAQFAADHGIAVQTEAIAKKNNVALDTKVWIPGSLMSYRDVECMLECVFLVNGLPGGKGHHDGHMMGRDLAAVLANPMLQATATQTAALASLRAQPKRTVVTKARPAAGTKNLELTAAQIAEVKLPDAGQTVSARAGVEAGYAAVAKAHPDKVFIVSCDLDPSTKLGKAKTFLKPNQCYELSIQEQLATFIANGVAMATQQPQLVAFSTFSAFFEGIAREGMEMWRYQRNLNGVNEGLNVTFHLSHVGSCTGRDHFSGWSLDWVNMALGYMPYLDRFYAPADARSAFVAIKDLAARYGGHLIAIPRDNLPILTKADGTALFNAGDAWQPCTAFRTTSGAKKAILAFGATAFLADEAVKQLASHGISTDAYVINGLPFGAGELDALIKKYPGGLVTIEDGLIGPRAHGLRGFASVVAQEANGRVKLAHLGIKDPRVAPSEGHHELWQYFGLTTAALVDAVKGL